MPMIARMFACYDPHSVGYLDVWSLTLILGRMDTLLFRHFYARFDTSDCFDAAHFNDAASSDAARFDAWSPGYSAIWFL